MATEKEVTRLHRDWITADMKACEAERKFDVLQSLANKAYLKFCRAMQSRPIPKPKVKGAIPVTGEEGKELCQKMQLSTRSWHGLGNLLGVNEADIKDSQILALTRRKMLSAKNLGIKSMQEIISAAKSVGLSIDEREPHRSDLAVYASRNLSDSEQAELDKQAQQRRREIG
jgi:DNA-directed RNA polymerase alpha subunit